MIYNQPFEQFEIFNLATLKISLFDSTFFIFHFTNYLFYLALTTFILSIPFFFNNLVGKILLSKFNLPFFKKINLNFFYSPFRLISTKTQTFLEKFYIFIFELIYQQVGFLGQQFVPLFFTLFSFILVANLIGLVPYSFTLTSHIILTFTLSFSIFIGLTILAIKYQPNFFALFIPKGVPSALIPFLFVIEIISYVSRTFSLAIRLFANMMSGHVLLHILTGFCAFLYSDFYGVIGKALFLIPFLLIVAIIGLEIGIAFLQAYVFCVLISIYLCDVFTLGH
jgi:ATP synthase subunit 6